MNNKTLASVVKEAREKIGISQRELSRITVIDNNTIAKIEKGERNIRITTFFDLAKGLDIHPRELLDFEL